MAAKGISYRRSHPLVRELATLAERSGRGLIDVVVSAGFERSLVYSWASRRSPNVTTLEACYNEIGYTLRPLPVNPDMKIETRQSKEYILTRPGGDDITVVNLARFCRENKLNLGSMYYAATSQSSYKGWRVRRA